MFIIAIPSVFNFQGTQIRVAAGVTLKLQSSIVIGNFGRLATKEFLHLR